MEELATTRQSVIDDVDILINTARLGDATSQHAFDLARALLAQGTSVQILTNFPVGPLPDDLRHLIRQIHPSEYRPTSAMTIVEYPLWYPLAEQIRQAPGTRVFWYHGVTDPALWPTQAGSDVLRNARARTRLAWQADLAIATSPFTAHELQALSGLPSERIRVVPLGIDLSAFADSRLTTAAAALRTSLGLGNREVYLYVGRCAEHKRIDLMIDALAELAQDPESVESHLLLVGDTDSTVETRDLVSGLKMQARRLGLSERVTFTGRVQAVEPYYRLAHVYIQASQHEGFGVPLIEAMAAGLPVVASASGAVPWVLGAEWGEEPEESKMAGLLFEPANGSSLANQLRRLSKERGLRELLQQRGHRRAGNFDLAHFRRNAVDALVEATQRSLQPFLAAPGAGDPLYLLGDVALRGYRVRSDATAVGPLIEWTRTNATTHLKEAYWDRIVELQVNYNRQLADEVIALRTKLAELNALVDALEARRVGSPTVPPGERP